MKQTTRGGCAAPSAMRLNSWALPVLFFLVVATGQAQSGSGAFSSINSGVATVVAFIRNVGGVICVGALVWAALRGLMARDFGQAVSGIVTAIIAMLVAGSAQAFISTFYSTTG